MSKQPISQSQHIETDHELQRLRGLAGFQAFEQQLETSLERLTQRWSSWRVNGYGPSAVNINRKSVLMR